MAKEIQLPAIVWMNIAVPKLNDNNPRTIKDPKFEKLVASLKDFPEMMALRPIVVNIDMVILGGNMRFRAAREAGMTQVPVIVAESLSDAQQYEFIIKDNVGFGDWDFDALANDWNELPLEDWGLDIPKTEVADAPDKVQKEKQYKLEVIALSEAEQDEIYEKLSEAGYDVKKK